MKRSLSTLALSALTAALFATLPAGAQAPNDAQKQPQGEARIVQRQGPVLEVERQQRPVAAVVFTAPADSASLEVSIVDSDPKNPNGDKEAIFSSRDAQKGVVTNDFGQTGNARRLMIMGRRDGVPVRIDDLGASGMARMFAVRREQPKQPQQDVAQQRQQQQQQQQPGGNAQPAAAAQAPAAQAPAAQPNPQAQEKPATPEQNDAVIFIYLAGPRQ
jgi:hypothetical protein